VNAIWSCVSVAVGAWILALAGVLVTTPALARDAGDPIRLVWTEGDVSGFTSIFAADGTQPIGFVEYSQRRRGDVLDVRRVAWFADGSSDEDTVEARVGKTLRTTKGRTILRDTAGRTTVDMRIDVAGGRVTGFYGLDKERMDFDEHGDLPAGTYFGPLINLVLKNFDANAEDGRLVFHTVVPTPGPRQIDMEIVRKESTTLLRPGHDVPAVQYVMTPSVNRVLNPLIKLVAPETHFFMTAGPPPALARFAGPRNYAGQEIRIE